VFDEGVRKHLHEVPDGDIAGQSRKRSYPRRWSSQTSLMRCFPAVTPGKGSKSLLDDCMCLRVYACCGLERLIYALVLTPSRLPARWENAHCQTPLIACVLDPALTNAGRGSRFFGRGSTRAQPHGMASRDTSA
jgi:hypothetical protein